MTNFETETCSRCGGSGRYSFNGRHSICYKCAGPGVTYTKRGKAAADLYTRLLSKPAGAVAVGDRLQFELIGSKVWVTVETIETTDQHLTIMGLDAKGNRYGQGVLLGRLTETLFREANTAEQKADKRAEALAYQATLTKAGKPGKRAA